MERLTQSPGNVIKFDLNAFKWNAEHRIYHYKKCPLSAIEQLIARFIHKSEQFPAGVAEEIGFAICGGWVCIPMPADKSDSSIGWMQVLFQWHFDVWRLGLNNSDVGVFVISQNGKRFRDARQNAVPVRS